MLIYNTAFVDICSYCSMHTSVYLECSVSIIQYLQVFVWYKQCIQYVQQIIGVDQKCTLLTVLKW